MRAALAFLLLAGLIFPAHADSLDDWCRTASLPSSIAVCSDPELRTLALQRQRAFDAARSRLDPAEQNALLADQKGWVRSYPASCGLAADAPPSLPLAPAIRACMAEAGSARIAYLWTYVGPAPATAQSAAAQTTSAVAPPIALTAFNRIGPGFDCAKATQPLARLICADPELSRTDLRFNQAYRALLQQLDAAGRQQLQQEDLEFLDEVKRVCGVPDTGAVAGSPGCVVAQYDRQREEWVSRLTGPAREEATRPIERHVALQADLQRLGFLPATAKVDGVYSAATRSAIVAWQNASGRPATGFIGEADATVFGGAEPHLVVGLAPVAPRPTPTTNNLTAVPPPRSSSGDDSANLNFWASVSANLIFWSSVFIAIICACYYLLQLKRKHQQQIIANLSKIIKDTVSLHAGALCRKRFQTLRDDDYGNLDLRTMAPWQTEIRYFLDTVLIPSIRGVEERDVFFQHIEPFAVELVYKLIEDEVGRRGNITFGPNFSPVDFENFCAEQLRTKGWQAHTTKASGDQGSDVIAEKGGHRLVIQCKLYNHPVGNKAVQEVAAARIHEQGDYAAVVTNSRYTSAARQLAATNRVLLLHHSDLRDIDDLLESQ